MKTLRIGIADYGQMKERTLAIARGDYRPARGEPTVWFTSLETMAKVLSEKNHGRLARKAQAPPNEHPQGALDAVDQCR